MCRLLGYAAAAPVTVRGVLGADEVGVFQDLALLHRDGWGTAWLDEQAGRVERELSPTSGAADDRLTRALARREAPAGLVHLRMATDGMACRDDNTHPFTADGIAFAHNGALKPAAAIEAFIAPELRAQLRGDTDSERYFAVIRTKLAQGLDLPDAVMATVEQLRPLFPTSSMNALILSPTHLIAVHASEGARIPHEDFDASGLGELLPRDHRDAYYLMRQRRLDDGSVVFASTGLDIAGWQPLPAESVAVLELASLQVEVRSLDTLARLAA
ncbi:class II glutamine amidotransferase [Rathayibacter sp. YIM 133350]|uniref:class II glutamine amidotransferase n=1 Tax=Rathayibacter sp. YIM 133350 TaxID=3131992 RepID=UPI00307E0F6E